MIPRVWGGGGADYKRAQGDFGGEAELFYILIVVVVTRLSMFAKMCLKVHSKGEFYST